MSSISSMLERYGVPHVEVRAQWHFELTKQQRCALIKLSANLEKLVQEFRHALTNVGKTTFPRLVNETIVILEWYDDNTDLESIKHDLQYLRAVSTSFDLGTSNRHGLNYSYVHEDLSGVVARLKHLVADTQAYLLHTNCM